MGVRGLAYRSWDIGANVIVRVCVVGDGIRIAIGLGNVPLQDGGRSTCLHRAWDYTRRLNKLRRSSVTFPADDRVAFLLEAVLIVEGSPRATVDEFVSAFFGT